MNVKLLISNYFLFGSFSGRSRCITSVLLLSHLKNKQKCGEMFFVLLLALVLLPDGICATSYLRRQMSYRGEFVRNVNRGDVKIGNV